MPGRAIRLGHKQMPWNVGVMENWNIGIDGSWTAVVGWVMV